MIDKERVPEIKGSIASQKELNAVQERLQHTQEQDMLLAEIWDGDTCQPDELMSNLTRAGGSSGQCAVESVKQDEVSSTKSDDSQLVQQNEVKLDCKLSSKVTGQSKKKAATQAKNRTTRKSVPLNENQIENKSAISIDELSKEHDKTVYEGKPTSLKSQVQTLGASADCFAPAAKSKKSGTVKGRKRKADSQNNASISTGKDAAVQSQLAQSQVPQSLLAQSQVSQSLLAQAQVTVSQEETNTEVTSASTKATQPIPMQQADTLVQPKRRGRPPKKRQQPETTELTETTELPPTLLSGDKLKPTLGHASKLISQNDPVLNDTVLSSGQDANPSLGQESETTSERKSDPSSLQKADMQQALELQSLSLSLSFTPHVSLIGATTFTPDLGNTFANAALSVALNSSQANYQKAYHIKTTDAASVNTIGAPSINTSDAISVNTSNNTSTDTSFKMLTAQNLAQDSEDITSLVSDPQSLLDSESVSSLDSESVSSLDSENVSSHDLLVALGLVSSTTTKTSSQDSVSATHTSDSSFATYHPTDKSGIVLPADFSITPAVKIYGMADTASKVEGKPELGIESKAEPRIEGKAELGVEGKTKLRIKRSADLKLEGKAEPRIDAITEFIGANTAAREAITEAKAKVGGEETLQVRTEDASRTSSWASQERNRLSRDLEPVAQRIADALEAEKIAQSAKGKHHDKGSLLKLDELFDIRKMQITGLTTGQLLQLWSKVDSSGFPINLPQRIIVRNYYKLFNMSDLKNCEIEYCFDPESEWYKNLANQASRYRSAVVSKKTKAKNTTNVESVNLEYDENEEMPNTEDDF